MNRFRPLLSAPVPAGWFVKESTTLLAPDGQANIIASSEPLSPEIDAGQYAEVQGDLLRKEFPGYREHSFEAMRLFGDRDGFMRRFEWEPPDGEPVTQIQVYYAEGGRGFTATATTPRKSIGDFEQEFFDVLEGLALEGDPSTVGAAVNAAAVEGDAAP
jgi:hypothetical protein